MCDPYLKLHTSLFSFVTIVKIAWPVVLLFAICFVLLKFVRVTIKVILYLLTMEGKKRNTNFTPDEKRILSELVLKYKDNVENKKTDAATNTQKNNAWIRLATEFNSVSTFCHRTHLSLRTCWDNIKRQSKKEKANIKKEAFKTGM